MTGYVYCAKCGDFDLFKIGHTKSPLTRLQALQTQSPFPMDYVIVLDVGTVLRSQAFEKFVQRSLLPINLHGEWHSNLDAIRDVFQIIAPAVDVTDKIVRPPKRPPPVNLPSTLEHLKGWLDHADNYGKRSAA